VTEPRRAGGSTGGLTDIPATFFIFSVAEKKEREGNRRAKSKINTSE